MPEQIIGSPDQKMLWIGNEGQIAVSGIVSANITGSITIGSVSASVDSIYIQSGAAPFGYTTNQIIRKACGSPAINYVFSNIAEAFIIDNLGSSPVYFALDSTANPANSGTGFIDLYSWRSFDGRVGSISIQGSGTTSPTVQVVRLS